MTDIAKKTEFDPASLGETLRDKIQVEVSDLMPPEVWQQLVQTEIDKFVSPYKETVGHRRDMVEKPSRLSVLVQQALEAKAKEQITELLSSEEWGGKWWSGNKEAIGVEIKKLVTENAGEILSSVLQSSIQGAVQSMRNNLNY